MKSIFNDWNKENTNFVEDEHLIGVLGKDSSISGEFHSSYNLSLIGILSVKNERKNIKKNK